MTIELLTVPASHIDRAWKDGAHKLSEACDTSGGEITGDQLKLILSRGERTLVLMRRDGEIAGWGVVRVDQLPNVRALFCTDMYAPGAEFADFFGELKKFAEMNGCSELRCAARAAQARLYSMKCGFEPVYTVMKVSV